MPLLLEKENDTSKSVIGIKAKEMNTKNIGKTRLQSGMENICVTSVQHKTVVINLKESSKTKMLLGLFFNNSGINADKI